jgi:hypothetical protein
LTPTPEAIPKRIVVEGREDEQVVFRFLNHCHFEQDFVRVFEKGGYNRLVDRLDVDLDARGLEQLGIIVDADNNIAARWDSLRNKLISCRFQTIPKQPIPAGTIIREPGLPVVGIWLMPDNKSAGNLENFVSLLIPSNDLLWPRARWVVDDIPISERRFAVGDLSKAHIYTWLAWQKEPGRPLGQAITQQLLDASLPEAQPFVDWLKQLFS